MSLQIAEPLGDETNVGLLRLLRDDPRLSVSELARRVKMSAPAVRERLQRLEEAGIVRWRIALDARPLGLPICAFVRLPPAPRQLTKIAHLPQRKPQVHESPRRTR